MKVGDNNDTLGDLNDADAHAESHGVIFVHSCSMWSYYGAITNSLNHSTY